MLPPTVTVIKVTNVLTPYIIRICEIKHYNEKLNSINKKLFKKKEIFKTIKKYSEPKIGDAVIVYNKLHTTFDFPGWLSRGHIYSIGNLKDTYNIFLSDHGICVVLKKEDFVICSTDIITEEYLSFTAGLYNVLPADVKYDFSMHNKTLTILDEWSTSAIEYTKELISASDTIYFDYLVSDQYGRYYGEFYLNIKNNIIRLSEILVLNHYAVYLDKEFLQNYEKIRSIAAINGKSERSLVAEMFNGCQILISTPTFLVRFMNRNEKLINFKNLRYLILDGGDIILNKYYDSVNHLFKKYNIISNTELKNKMLQIIITATHWTPQLKKVAFILMDNPYICIASFLEAAIFKSVHINIYVINSKKKNEKLLDLLNNRYSYTRTIIICTNNNEAEELYNFLQKHVEILLAHGNMNFFQLQDIKQCWNVCISGSYPILICTDDILSDIDITNVTWLIHYSIPLHSKTQFNFRFSTLIENLQMENCNCKVTIMMDENNDIQFLHIMKIMQRMNIIIPQNILENIKFITNALEKKKENYPICDNIKSWGFCNKQVSCAFRHKIISKIDIPLTNIQINDKVKFRVVSILDATHVSARIISYIKFDTLEEIEFPNTQYMLINKSIQEYYSCAKNRKKCEIIDIGCICGLEEPVDTFKRVQILHIERENKTGNPKYVNVKCIDNGVILNKVNVYNLLYMPKELIKYPIQVFEVFLVGIAPHDDEYIWNNCAIDAVYEWFKENVDNRSYVIGTVNLHLGNTIWVDSLNVGTKLIGYKDLIGSSIKTELLLKDHAVKNDKHLNQMYQLCRDAGFLQINGYDLNL